MDHNKLIIPETKEWDYKKRLTLPDVELWEVIYEEGGGIGVYVSYIPYAEFYMIRNGWKNEISGYGPEMYYGPGSLKKVKKRMKELGIPENKNKIWIDNNDMWLYEEDPTKNPLVD
jgi:hypothetical protein